MGEKNGQTSSPLKVKLPSAILGARWESAEVARGGSVTLEVKTILVADGSEIKVVLKDLEGKTVDTLKGKVVANLFRYEYKGVKPNASGGLTFEAEIPSQKLKASGGKVKVPYPVKITDLKLYDDKGKVLKELTREVKVEVRAKVEGPPPETPCTLSFSYQTATAKTTLVHSTQVKPQAGKITFAWNRLPLDETGLKIQSELDKTGETYFSPRFQVELDCLGVRETTATDYLGWAEFDFGPLRGKAVFTLPDGAKKSETIPKDGIIKLDKPKAGRIHIKELSLE